MGRWEAALPDQINRLYNEHLTSRSLLKLPHHDNSWLHQTAASNEGEDSQANESRYPPRVTTTGEWLRDERLGLVAWLSDLSAPDWDTPSLCRGWTVRHVVAHLVTPFVIRPSQMAVQVARARGLSGAMDAVARDLADRPPEALLALLQEHAASTFRPPGLPLSAPLTDVVVHGADIRWALGDGRGDWAEVERLRPVLDFLVSARALAGFMPRKRTRGLHLIAQDQDWSSGSGDEVRGTSLALALGLLGRAAALPLLDGIGVVAMRG